MNKSPTLFKLDIKDPEEESYRKFLLEVQSEDYDGGDKARKLDQFYTDDDVAIECLNLLKTEFPEGTFDNKIFIEPSAGTGAFIKAAIEVYGEDVNVLAYDIEPKYNSIIKANFLEVNLEQKKEYVTIGNPPFGKRSELAIKFINKAMEYSDIVAFILPLQFNKWLTQKKVDKRFKLIKSHVLKSDSFIFENKKYDVRSVFQIWTRIDTSHKDLRIKSAPPIKHPDFKMWQYNGTPTSARYFDYDWDFAVPRQGYKDYSERIMKKEDLKDKTQYIFFKAKDDKVRDKLINIDFEELSKLNTSTPGFGKADVVAHYSTIYSNNGGD